MARMPLETEKRPRQYAAEILALPRSEHATAIARVPDRWRSWAQHYVDDAEWRLTHPIPKYLPKFCYSPLQRQTRGIVIHYFSAINVDRRRWSEPRRCWELFHDLNLEPQARQYRIYDGPRLPSSADCFIARDGRAWELVPPGHRSWHAGHSRMNDRDDCNSFCAGYELIAAPQAGGEYGFTEAQYIAAAARARRDMEAGGFGTEWIKGHDEVRRAWNETHPDRQTSAKHDPGPTFDWPKFFQYLKEA